jgi:hypothetical protein
MSSTIEITTLFNIGLDLAYDKVKDAINNYHNR